MSSEPVTQPGWSEIADRITGPLLANQLEGFRQLSPVERVGLVCHWTDSTVDDSSISGPAKAGRPSSCAITWASQHGVTELELHGAYAALAQLLADGQTRPARGGNVTH